MQIQAQIGLDQILDRLKDILQRLPDRMLANIRRDTPLESGATIAECTVEYPGGKVALLIEYKKEGLPGIIRRSAWQLRSHRSALATSDVLPVFAAPYISDEGLDVCREEGIGCIDEAGNCLLPLPGAYVEIRGKKNPRPITRPIKSLFSPKSSRILRALLSDVGRWWQVQELASEAMVSNGLVSRIKQRLLDEEFVSEHDRRIQVRSPRKVISAWAENYTYKRNELNEYYSLDDTSKVEDSIAGWCGENGIRYALGLFSAAARIAPHVRMNKAFIFVDTDPVALAQSLQFKPVSSGPNVMLLRPYDQGVFYNSSESEGLNIVSDIQTYIDLKSYRGRGGEAADFLMEQVLEKQWVQSQNMGSAR
jgi:hypothetical protein